MHVVKKIKIYTLNTYILKMEKNLSLNVFLFILYESKKNHMGALFLLSTFISLQIF